MKKITLFFFIFCLFTQATFSQEATFAVTKTASFSHEIDKDVANFLKTVETARIAGKEFQGQSQEEFLATMENAISKKELDYKNSILARHEAVTSLFNKYTNDQLNSYPVACTLICTGQYMYCLQTCGLQTCWLCEYKLSNCLVECPIIMAGKEE